MVTSLLWQTDTQLHGSVQRQLDQIPVIVRHGFLTLEGAVEWIFQKVAAGSAVAYLDGVKSVSNLIQVKPGVARSDQDQ
jgi:osmotically-inducible protein OsmY